MSIKSLLLTAVTVSAGISAYAFPTITTYPEPESTNDNVYYLANIQLMSSEDFSIVSDCDMKPYFENWDTGDLIYCSEFYDQNFYGSILHKVNFNESDFSDNGEWVLTLPAGCLKDSEGNANDEAIEFHYTLDDPNIGLGDFPQITLLSSDPANGASLPFWGETLGKVKFVTDQDDAVNYIGWTLYDITNGTGVNEREWMRQGNENRIDVNRTFGDASDQWANGLFINVGGVDEKLLLGHTYRLELQFCGIGYNPETNQYPTQQQLQQSLELSTYLDFQGLVPGTEYSPYNVVSVSPDPAEYDFDNIDMRTFTIVYSGHVKPTEFVYSLGQGSGAVTAGEITPASDPNADGYAEVWDFTFYKSVIESVTGTIAVTIQAEDEDGLKVKGNGGFITDDFEYKIDWRCNLGADKIVSVYPLNEAVVEELSTITVKCELNKPINLSYLTADRPTLVGRSSMIALDLDEPEFSDDFMTATWTFDPITTPDSYMLIIPRNYFIIGTEMFTTYNNQTTFIYVIEGEGPGGEVIDDLVPIATSIEDGAQAEAPVWDYTLTFGNVTYISYDPMVPATLYYRAPGSDVFEVFADELYPIENDFFEPTEYMYELISPAEEDGEYKFVVPAGVFFDGAYDESAGQTGHVSPELVYTFTIGDVIGGEVFEDLVPIATSIEDGAQAEAPVWDYILTFENVTYISYDPMVPATLYFRAPGADEFEVFADELYPIENDFFEPTEYMYELISPAEEDGEYKFVVPAGVFFDGAYDESMGQTGHVSPELVYTFKIGDWTSVKNLVSSDTNATVYDVAGRVVLRDADASQLKNLAAGVYIINGKKYVVK